MSNNYIDGDGNNIAGRDINIHNYPNSVENSVPKTKEEILVNLKDDLAACKRSLFINRRQLVFLPTTIALIISFLCIVFLGFHFVYDLLALHSWKSTSWVSDFYFIDTKRFSNPLYMMIPAGFIVLLTYFHRQAITPIIYNISLLKSEIQAIKTDIQRVKTRN